MTDPKPRLTGLIWKNKANFQIGRMGVSIYMKGYYEDLCGFWLRENKANFIGVNDGFVIPVKTGIQIC